MFSSEDLKKWSYCGILAQNHNQYGKMWECPDFFPLDGQHVLLISPQEMCTTNLEFHNGNGTLCIIGKYDLEEKKLLRETVSAIDYGLDFYAPQTLEMKDGRRVMIGWMQSWDNHITPNDFSWSGLMTIPRELSVKNGRLYQNPVRELTHYYQNKVSYEGIVINKEVMLQGIQGRKVDMTVEIQKGDYTRFQIHLAKNSEYETVITYRPQEETLTFDRTFSGYKRDVIANRSMYVENNEGAVKIRILLDLYSVEIFVNDGERAMTSLIYTEQQADQIIFEADKDAICSVVKYDVVVD